MSPNLVTTNAPLRSDYADDAEMQDIIRLFVAESPQRIAALRAAWDARDLNGLRRLSHQLTGAAAGYGFPALSQAAGDLEHSLRALVEGGAAAPLSQLRPRFNHLLTLCGAITA